MEQHNDDSGTTPSEPHSEPVTQSPNTQAVTPIYTTRDCTIYRDSEPAAMVATAPGEDCDDLVQDDSMPELVDSCITCDEKLKAIAVQTKASRMLAPRLPPRPPPVAIFHKDKGPTHLRIVDPFDDEGVWAIVDEGCNVCTHSDTWRHNAVEKWAKLATL